MPAKYDTGAHPGRRVPDPKALRLAAVVKMDAMGMRQSDLARELHVPDAALTGLFAHEKVPPPYVLWALAWWLNVSPRMVSTTAGASDQDDEGDQDAGDPVPEAA